MRIDLRGEIAGIPAQSARKLLRASRGWYGLEVDYVAELLDVSPRRALVVLNALEAAGYLRQRDKSGREDTTFWDPTIKGSSLAMATGARPLRRATADRLVRDLIDRARFLECEPHRYAFLVGELTVFGSYLLGQDRINDIDVGYMLLPRFSDKDRQHKYCGERIGEAVNAGRRFSNCVDELTFPWWEMLLFLKARSRAYSLHDLKEEREFIEARPHRLLYQSTRTSLEVDPNPPTSPGRASHMARDVQRA